jgi:hypothetical protein
MGKNNLVRKLGNHGTLLNFSINNQAYITLNRFEKKPGKWFPFWGIAGVEYSSSL